LAAKLARVLPLSMPSPIDTVHLGSNRCVDRARQKPKAINFRWQPRSRTKEDYTRDNDALNRPAVVSKVEPNKNCLRAGRSKRKAKFIYPLRPILGRLH
jgi:hypothetical protein